MSKELIAEARQLAEQAFKEQLPEHVTYHTLEHTQWVVDKAIELAELSKLKPEAIELLTVAGWFHDIGFVKQIEGHEEVGAKMARTFLQERGLAEDKIIEVEQIIRSTHYEIEPVTLSERIINDADVSHLGTKTYFKRADLLRQEWEYYKGQPMTDEEWCQMNLVFFDRHSFKTEAGRELFEKRKAKNYKKIKQKLDAMSGDHPKKEEKVKRPDRGIETLFRITLKNHIQLSQIADNKANIMLSINAIIISIVLTSLLPKLDNNTYLIWPSVLLLTVCILSVVLATASTIPKVTHGKTDREAVENRSANLLFFGNFHNMPLDDFNWGMNQVMEDREYLYGSMIKDLYYLGKVLHKKYKYLRWCYTAFMIGIILSVLAFMISLAYMFQPPV